MRLFLAITPPVDVLDRIVDVQNILRLHIERQGVRFVKPGKMHLSLAFLGDDADPEDAPDIADSVLKGSGQLELRLGELLCFPDRRRPKTVALNVESEGLVVLAEAVHKAFGLPAGAYVPHVTLARVSPASQAVGRLLSPVFPEIQRSSEWVATEVDLIKTLPDGDYETLHRVFL